MQNDITYDLVEFIRRDKQSTSNWVVKLENERYIYANYVRDSVFSFKDILLVLIYWS